MNPRNWLYGALFTMSLTALAADPPRTPAKGPGDWEGRLKNASPLVPLKLARCTAAAGGACIVQVTMGDKCDPERKPDPDILQVGRKVTIFWKLSGGNWEFDQRAGIRFGSPVAFENGRRLAPNVWQWKVKASPTSGLYSYKVLLRAKDGTTCEIDPGIWV